MKQVILFSSFIMIAFASCKKSESTFNEVTYGLNCRIISEMVIMQNDTMFSTSEYSPDRKLIRRTGTVGYLDTTTSTWYYVYDGNRCSYCYSGNDTMFFGYNGSGLLVSYRYKDYMTPYSVLEQYHEYSYDGSFNVVTEQIWIMIDSLSIKMDSMIYQYSNGNITKIIQYGKSGTGWEAVNVDLTYDDQRNFFKASGDPPYSMLSWSRNNMKSYVYDGDTVMVFHYLEYNEYGYPVTMNYRYYYYQPDTITSTMKITYQCP